ncbi:UPF0687 protein C20orf27 homolog [Haliotis rufescens]|uniref:UPF0687 protein C20orf27 homolog n=1 Tax=Haliotis rufescens TaxID=6454 RepID=UPI001EB013AE|nr:UPF0687 protein C20orf27 homolog [Haliotis rufescens]
MADHSQVTAGHHQTDRNGHVHFPADQVVTHDSEIQIVRQENKYDVHLGFLQFRHLYKVTFCVKDTLGEDIEADPLQNLHVKMESYQPTEDGEGHQVVVIFNAHREKVLEESLKVTDSKDKSKSITLAFHARVLGKGQGTPALRNGIHCLSVDWDEDSDVSDWQGFN